MTSETDFSRHNSSTWRFLTPTMELYIRRINLELTDRVFVPMSTSTVASRRGFINEVAFEVFAASPRGIPVMQADVVSHATSVARLTLSKIEGTLASELTDPDDGELDDIKEQVRRLAWFFENQSKHVKLETRPRFSGCGIIGSCQGDVYFPGTLFEIKAGDRQIRSTDLRQLLVYAALDYADKRRSINRIGLFNPRVGTYFTAALDNFCLEVAGRPSFQLLSEMVRIFSSGDISR